MMINKLPIMQEPIYISGAISNDPDYRQKFNSAEIKLRNAGYSRIINPVELADNLEHLYRFEYGELPDEEDYLQNDLNYLIHCNSVYRLNDHEFPSFGSDVELKQATEYNIQIFYEE